MSTMEPVRSGLRLRVIEGAFHAEFHRLERSLISIGRSTPETVSSASYITFPEPTVSRLHAVLTWESGAKAYLLHHRSQTNPTVLNNAVITGPSLLKAGDRITLGRLVLLVEPDTETATAAPSATSVPVAAEASSPEATIAPTPTARRELSLNAKIEGGDRIFSAPVKERVISLTFANDRGTAVVGPGHGGEGWQEVRLPASQSSALRFELDPISGTCTVEAGRADVVPTVRVSHGRLGTELRVPLRPGQNLPFVETDVILHQGFRIWLGDPDRPPDSETTLTQKPKTADTADERRMTLIFLNGPWKEATISAPAAGASNIRVGPGDIGFRHAFPLTQLPVCDITVQAGIARLRAVEVSDDQFLEVDGDLVFASESVTLIGGSRLLLGDAEFLWMDGNESLYTSFRLVDGQSAYPVRKASVRLGTAAHCEIMLPGRELPPVIGRISFETGEPVYHHTDISAPIRVDGEEASIGLSVPLKPGSLLELKPGKVLSLERTAAEELKTHQ